MGQVAESEQVLAAPQLALMETLMHLHPVIKIINYRIKKIFIIRPFIL